MLWYEMILRLVLAIVVGFVIGMEREHSQHPAGLRTHILVSIGACVVMLTGTSLWNIAIQYGGNPDPARLGAQVISGIGFLGAGTIIKDGFSIRGLTTAASLWTVACIGLAAGSGFYMVTIFSTVAVAITLTAFDVFRRIVHQETMSIKLVSSDPSETIQNLEALGVQHQVTLTDLQFRESRDYYKVSVTARFKPNCKPEEINLFLLEVGQIKTARGMESIRNG